MIAALANLLVFQLVGEAVVVALHAPVPGPVVGMALLLLTLMARPAWLAALMPTAQGLLQHLSLLFVPYPPSSRGMKNIFKSVFC